MIDPTIYLQMVAPEATEELLPILRDADEGNDRIRATLHNNAYLTYAALQDEQLIGAATVRWEQEESEIEYIAVKQNLRGRGYGRTIIALLLAQARLRGVSSLLVGTANSSLENIAFYMKCGFRMDHIRHDYFQYIQPPLEEHGIRIQDMLVFRYRLEV